MKCGIFQHLHKFRNVSYKQNQNVQISSPCCTEGLFKRFYDDLFFSATKASLVASVVFLCERLNLIAVPHPLIYFGIVLFFVYFKISSVVLGIHDPFVPLENLLCAIFMGGMWDALRRAASKETAKEDESKDPRNDVIKSKEEKKKD